MFFGWIFDLFVFIFFIFKINTDAFQDFLLKIRNQNTNASVSMRVSTKGLTYNPDPDHHTDKNNCRQLSVRSHLKQ